MDWTARVRDVLRAASQPPDDDVIEELAQHAAAMYEAARADGCSHEEAECRLAEQLERWRFEAAALKHQRRRPAAIEPPPAASSARFAGLVNDVRYAARLIRRQPRLPLLMILTMALGIGATTALFSVTYGVLMKPLPWPRSDRLVVLKETRGGRPPRFGDFTNATYLAWRDRATTIEHIAAWSQRLVTLSAPSEPERIRIAATTASLFAAIGAKPLIGSFFEEKDEASPVIVLGEGLWRRRFGADPGVLGSVVRLDGEPHTVIGVLPGDLAYPDRQTVAVVPYSVRPADGNHLSMFSAIALLRPGMTPAQASAEGTARGRFVPDTDLSTTAIFGSDGPVEIAAEPLHQAMTGEVRGPLTILLIAVGLLLVTAAANVASLQLARTTARRREIAIRAALGAGSARVTRQLLVEGLVVGLSGGLAGLAFAWALHRFLPTLLPPDFPRVDDLSIDATVVAFAFVITVGASIACGQVPAFPARRLNLAEVLSEDGTATVGGGVRTARIRMLIIAGQVAIACVLLVGASLLGRTFLALLNADRGYDPSDILSARLSLPPTMYPAPEQRLVLVNQVLDRLAAMPGMVDVSFTSELPLTPGGSSSAFNLKSPAADGGIVRVQASPRIVSPRYFSTIGMHMIAGRAFTDSDTETAEPVVVVNRVFARRYLGDSPLGWKIPVVAYGPPDGEPLESTVIGVVDDVRYVTMTEVSQPELYYSHRQMRGRLPVHTITLLARTSGDLASAAAALRSVVRQADEGLVAEAVLPLEQRLLTTLARPRLYATLLGGFAGFAVVIAFVGLVGVLSYVVSLRSRELALRAALGAGQVDLQKLILGQGLAVTIAGLCVGLLASTWFTRLVSRQLYGVAPLDGVTFVAAPLLLLVVAAVACLVPARRAALLDPVRVLRGG